jgi:GT2 family glycosyltransferase
MIETLPLSVAVCTRDRPDKLKRALQSLLRQQPRPHEILVIDNASASDATRELVTGSFPDVRYIRESIPGLDFARNRALREAQEAIVAFLDDDAVADEGWTEALWQVFRRQDDVGICTGRTDAYSLETEAECLFEANGGFSRGDQTVTLPSDARHKKLHGFSAPLIAWAVSVGNGANFAVRREAAQKIGGFDDAFDLGDALHGGGDLDLFWRMLRGGYRLVYEPAARVRHEHRRDLEHMSAQLASHQKSLIAFLCKSVQHARGRQQAAVFCFLLWRLVKPGWRLCRRLLGQDPLPAGILLQIGRETWKGLTAYRQARAIAVARKAASRIIRETDSHHSLG